VLRVALAADPADIALAVRLIMDELFTRAFVFHRAAEQSLIEPQGNPHQPSSRTNIWKMMFSSAFSAPAVHWRSSAAS